VSRNRVPRKAGTTQTRDTRTSQVITVKPVMLSSCCVSVNVGLRGLRGRADLASMSPSALSSWSPRTIADQKHISLSTCVVCVPSARVGRRAACETLQGRAARWQHSGGQKQLRHSLQASCCGSRRCRCRAQADDGPVDLDTTHARWAAIVHTVMHSQDTGTSPPLLLDLVSDKRTQICTLAVRPQLCSWTGM
jgi:hypothetical protein